MENHKRFRLEWTSLHEHFHLSFARDYIVTKQPTVSWTLLVLTDHEQYILFFCVHELEKQAFCNAYLWALTVCSLQLISHYFAFSIHHQLQIKPIEGLVFPAPSLCDPSTFLMGRPSLLLPSPHFLFAFPLSSSIQLSWHPAVLHRLFLVNKQFYITMDCFPQLSVTGQILTSVKLFKFTEFSEGTQFVPAPDLGHSQLQLIMIYNDGIFLFMKHCAKCTYRFLWSTLA